jgi:hypothetical protein
MVAGEMVGRYVSVRETAASWAWMNRRCVVTSAGQRAYAFEVATNSRESAVMRRSCAPIRVFLQRTGRV